MEGIEELRAKIIELENEIKLLKEGHKTKREKMKAENSPSLVPCKCSICEKEFKNKYKFYEITTDVIKMYDNNIFPIIIKKCIGNQKVVKDKNLSPFSLFT